MSLTKTFLALGISVFFVLFVAYALFIFYEPPQKLHLEDTNCSLNCTKLKLPSGYEHCFEKEQKCLNEARLNSPRFRNKMISFFILLGVGIAAIVLGIYLSQLEGIGSGFIGGGILTLLWSLIYTQEYWTRMSRYFKLAAIGFVLLILIYLGYKKMERFK